jgi:hypothetical protein
MSNAQKFFNMAIRESNLPDSNNDAGALAEIEVIGAIGMLYGADGRDEFIKAGFSYLDVISL